MRTAVFVAALVAAGIAGYLAATLAGSNTTTIPPVHTSTITVTETITTTTTITVTARAPEAGQVAGKPMPGNMEHLAEELKRECSTCHTPPKPEELEVIPGPMRKPTSFEGRVVMIGDKIAVVVSPDGVIIHAVRLPMLCSVKPGDAVAGSGLLAMRLANDTRWILVKTEDCRVEQTGS